MQDLKRWNSGGGVVAFAEQEKAIDSLLFTLPARPCASTPGTPYNDIHCNITHSVFVRTSRIICGI